MPTSKSSVSIEASPDDVFAFVCDPDNIPGYTTAGVDGAQEMEKPWFRVHDGHRHRVEWGADGPSDYHGWLEVDREGEVASVTAEVHTEDGTAEDLDRAVDAVLFALKERIERH